MDSRALIAASPLLGRLPADAIDRLAEHAQPLGLRGGETLFERGEAPDALYIVALGRVRIDLAADDPHEVAVGDLVGEIGVLTGEPRMAAAVALRDTLLLRFDAVTFRRIISQSEAAERALWRKIVERLRDPGRTRRTSRTHAVAVLPLTEDADENGLARRLAAALAAVLDGHVPLIDRAAVDRDLGPGAAQARFDSGSPNARLVGWLHERESEAAHVVLSADGVPEPWTLRAARQADRILLVAGDGPLHTDTLQALATAGAEAPRELVSCGEQSAASRLLAESGAAFLHQCPGSDAGALQRLARHVAGRATGLVLGGGGARGFAHIGLLRALEEAGVPIDLVGGTSMGAFIAALHARGLTPAEMRDVCHDAFVARNHLNDWVLPRVSLIRGRKFLGMLRRTLGDGLIEDLPLPFFCVSTNLTRGQPQIHRRGELAVWVGTSMAVPGIAPPVVYRGELLADGAVVNSVPVDAMHALDRGPVIACDVGASGELALPGVDGPDPEGLLNAKRSKRPQLSEILMRMTTLTSDLRLKENVEHADLFVRMPVADVGMFQWDALDATIETGYRHAREVLEAAAADWPGDLPPPGFRTAG
ncbi:patatin-like phospholipase family protein [Algiphilus sp.]|uniref:patatin-like phospholipase family protein n=1 Tax=Algiphilus sp. TaxID=1872431 RepID=UPI003C5F6988